MISSRRVIISFHVAGQGRITPLVVMNSGASFTPRRLAGLCEQSGAEVTDARELGGTRTFTVTYGKGNSQMPVIHGTHLRHYNHLNIGEPCLSSTRQQERRIRHTPSAGFRPGCQCLRKGCRQCLCALQEPARICQAICRSRGYSFSSLGSHCRRRRPPVCGGGALHQRVSLHRRSRDGS